MTFTSDPALAPFERILTTWDRTRYTITVVMKDPAGTTSAPDGPYFGLLDDEFLLAIDEASVALEKWTVVAIAAASEKMFFDDARCRVVKRTRDAVRRPLRDSFLRLERQGVTIGLDVVLKEWRRHAGGMNESMKAYERLFTARHWSAHGSRWTPKGAFAGGPLDAFMIVEDVVGSLRREVPDFPLGS